MSNAPTDSSTSSRDFATALSATRRPLMAYALSLCRKREVAEDLTQQTMLKAWANRERYVETGQFISWLFAILRRLWLDEIKRAKTHQNAAEAALIVGEAVSPSAYDRIVVRQIVKFVAAKNPDAAHAMMHDAFGFTYSDYQKVRDVPTGTYQSRCWRARNAVKTHFGAD